MGAMATRPFTVECLCAEWCGVCRDYRAGFQALAERFTQAEFRWLDVEDDAEAVGDLDVESFPTVSIRRGDTVLFHGALLPHHEHLARLLEKLIV
jgi:thiol-disulfide isomerase/thioredoxin